MLDASTGSTTGHARRNRGRRRGVPDRGRSEGTPFSTTFLDELTGGGGAKPAADGTDTSGTATSPGATADQRRNGRGLLPHPLRLAAGAAGFRRAGPLSRRRRRALRLPAAPYGGGDLALVDGARIAASDDFGRPRRGAGRAERILPSAAPMVAIGSAPRWTDLIEQMDITLPTAGHADADRRDLADILPRRRRLR